MEMDLTRSINIIKKDILDKYNEWKKAYPSVEFNYMIGEYNMESICKIEIFLTIFENSITVDIANNNYSLSCATNYDDTFKEVFCFSVCLIDAKSKPIKDENLVEKTISVVLTKIYNIKKDFKYSKIIDYLIPVENFDEREDLCKALNFFTNKNDITECCVCSELNVVQTVCKHSLCRECYNKLEKLNCPMCRNDLRH